VIAVIDYGVGNLFSLKSSLAAIGQEAVVTETIDNTVPTGAVYADGKTWTARSASGRVIPKDTMVKVQRMEGVRLFVEEEAGQPVHS